MRVDITGRLPVELAIIILRNLDPRSLLSAAMVNKRWLSLCRADSVLRERIRQQIVTERQERLKFTVTVERDIQQPRPFSAVNGNRRITFNPVSKWPPNCHPHKIQPSHPFISDI
ncbi:hypothetical protein ANN_23903 [Periplaneta americana]|uniref:F-box domain-containing protein n=1 Tax=Periplaneta americana TaxID=6978 RepID=A0ABQ8S224_PERAM|nr:hypothetical protein ANN_23903 [Periplaneta americana]